MGYEPRRLNQDGGSIWHQCAAHSRHTDGRLRRFQVLNSS